MKMLKSKNIRRICVLFAMLAPVVYLFGSLFAALTGAHGTQVFAGEVMTSEIDYDVTSNNVTYRRFLYSEDDWSLSATVVVGGSFRIGSNFVVSGDYSVSSLPNGDVGDTYLLCSFTSYPAASFSFVNGSDRLPCVSWYSTGFYFEYIEGTTYRYYSYNQTVAENAGFGTSVGSNINVSNYPIGWTDSALEWLDTVRKIPAVQPRVVVDVGESPEGYSDYVFGQFFAKDNFLEQIGKDVLSETPHGFVPFASFWKYLDTNMLHMGDMQLGLMGYGYVYYCCHVLLFDIAFILVTFFLDFIQKVNDKVVGGVD